jgi:hypothetical protein
MQARSRGGEVVDHLIDWLKKEPWHSRWLEFQSNTLEEVASHSGITIDQIRENTSDGIAAGILFGVLFERFMEVEFEDAPYNIVDSYLQRRGWKESKQGKLYIQQLRETPFSLYEVIDVVSGKSVTVRDLIRPLPAVEVIEVQGSQQISPLDHLMLKVLELDGQHYFSGSLLLMPSSVTTSLVEQIRLELQAKHVSLIPENYLKEAKAINGVLHTSGLKIMAEAIGHLISPDRQVVNAEGHSILLTEIRFPVNDRGQIIGILDGHPEFERADTEEDEQPFWNWLLLDSEESQKSVSLPERALVLKTDLFLSEGNMVSVRGNVELTPQNKLLCSLMSRERGDVLLPLLTSLLGDAVGTPVTTYQSLESMEANQRKAGSTLDISSEEAQEAMAEFLDNHYRGLLDTVIPALGGRTPQEASQTAEGKAEIVKWLRHLEVGQERDSNDGRPQYDFSWMWQALGVEHLKPTNAR